MTGSFAGTTLVVDAAMVLFAYTSSPVLGLLASCHPGHLLLWAMFVSPVVFSMRASCYDRQHSTGFLVWIMFHSAVPSILALLALWIFIIDFPIITMSTTCGLLIFCSQINV